MKEIDNENATKDNVYTIHTNEHDPSQPTTSSMRKKG